MRGARLRAPQGEGHSALIRIGGAGWRWSNAMTALVICVAWLVLAGVAVAELHGWRRPRREPEAESREGEKPAS